MANIGFIGLGHMGLPMAINLIKAGHQVCGYDLQKSALDEFADAGGTAAASLAKVAEGKEIMITMLQTGQQVKQVCLGANGFYQSLPSALHIDCSTIDVETSRELHAKAQIYQLLSLDAPVSGGVKGATAGTLTFMAGGDEAAFTLAKPLLSAMGKTIYHTGQAGSGQAAKICNNMILGVSMIAISEAFVLAEHLGLSAQKLYDVVNNSSGQCWAMSQYVPVPGVLPDVPANHDYQPGFTVAMMLKDLVLSQNASSTSTVKTLLGDQAARIYQRFNDEGFGHLDFSAIIKTMSKHS